MTALLWDQIGQRTYETGVDHGVLYRMNTGGVYDEGFAWNGLVTVTESPTGAEATAQYADNIKYLNLTSAEEFGGTIEAFTYPNEFAECDGTAVSDGGIEVGQQTRRMFGLCYRTKLGNDTVGNDYAYKLHLVYGATATPSERAYGTINDSPEPITFSWEFTTYPISVGTVDGVVYKPTSTIVIPSNKVDATTLADLEAMLYGGVGTDPTLPLPADVIALFVGTVSVATPTAPTYVSGTHTITIPTVTGVVYKINGITKTGAVVITEDTVVNAYPTAGYKFPAVIDSDWFFDFV